MPSFGVWEWVVILVIVLVIFGASRLKDIGSGLGGPSASSRRPCRRSKTNPPANRKKTRRQAWTS